ncbi:MAG: UbiA family prenyltransferase, partial [Pseudomonadota bacterium]
SFVLFLIIFMWTPPHFWALALFKSGDYRSAGVPMLPVVAGETNTRHQILVYSVLLAPIGVAPHLLGYASPVYGAASAVLGAIFVMLAADIWRKRDGDVARQACIRLFKFSIFYLFMLFALLLGESLIAGA